MTKPRDRQARLIDQLTAAYTMRKRTLGVFNCYANQKARGFKITDEKLTAAKQAYMAADRNYIKLLKLSNGES